MEIKRLPEDFQVKELTDVAPARGDFALYRLAKRWIGTPEAIDALLRAWNLPRRRVAYGGMKDFHAVTQQYLTIHRGPKRDFRAERFHLTYLGQTPRAITAADIRGNRFHIVVRDLDAVGVQRLQTAAAQVAREGFPNYFDDQRFGSVGKSGEFIAAAWMKGHWERALWLALADPNAHDDKNEQEQKRLLREHWGQWARCKQVLERSHRRSLVTYLADHPQDFRGAFARLRVDMRRLYLSAFQSRLWNEILAAILARRLPPGQLGSVPLRFGQAPYHRDLPADDMKWLRELSIALPSSRAVYADPQQRCLAEEAVGRFDLSLEQLRVKFPRDCFFTRGTRRAVVFPQFTEGDAQPDELHAGRLKLPIVFELPRGAYATIALKRLTEGELGAE